MNHKEVIQVIQAHEDRKQLQQLYGAGWGTVDVSLEDLLRRISESTIRIKPVPSYVPWTTDDWKIFNSEYIQETANNRTYRIYAWNIAGVYAVPDKNTITNEIFVTYKDLLDKFMGLQHQPCGKLII
jgi:hypothetical protein